MTDVSNSRTNKEIQAVTIRSIEKEKIRANTFYFEKTTERKTTTKKPPDVNEPKEPRKTKTTNNRETTKG